ncbi:hypothetical protein R0131_18025 [Clostridium sp. AL.422]|uniref:hypothetical protein n=1 Tax=Clostridium TaxID=1485 RepID=UPI00293DD9A8|nr:MULTISPECIES: hypothetical protein [unclassified Clostridium]MDV4152730.1 hypothetical protein [Clostridium sp. AL.422]
MDENKIIEVNELLKKGYSLNQLEKDKILECSRKAFKNRAAKINYQYDDNIKQFIKISNTISVTNSNSNINSNTNSNSVTNSNTEVTLRKSKEAIIKNTKETDLILQSLEERIKALESIVLQNNTKVTPDTFTIELKKDIITRSIKVSKTIIDDFNNLAETKFSMYNKQDLLNKALTEFVEKYK